MSNWKSVLDFPMVDPFEMELLDGEKEKIYKAVNTSIKKRAEKLLLGATAGVDTWRFPSEKMPSCDLNRLIDEAADGAAGAAKEG